MIPAPTPEFLILAAVMAASSGFAVYMAARPGRVAPETFDIEDDEMAEEQLTFDDALANREAVLAEVAENNSEWMAEAISAIEALPVGTQGTGEDIRILLREAGLSAPKHPNAFGALFNTAKRRGLIAATGEYRPMRLKSSHGRETRVYARVPQG